MAATTNQPSNNLPLIVQASPSVETPNMDSHRLEWIFNTPGLPKWGEGHPPDAGVVLVRKADRAHGKAC